MVNEPLADQLIWLDGSFIRWSEATMHVSAHHYGVGVFEGTRSYAVGSRTCVFRLRDHTARLLRSARLLRLAIPEAYDAERLDAVQLELLEKNRLGDAYLRPFVFYGGTRGL